MSSQTGGLIQWLAAGVKTTAGVAAASGKVRFYDPGSLTPHAVYSDSGLSSAITQPITLSAGGTAIVYTAAPLRMIVKDSTDTTTLYDVVVNVVPAEQIDYKTDNQNSSEEFNLSSMIDYWSTSANPRGVADGGGNGFFKYSYSSTAAERKLKDWMGEVHVSVKDFGAVGNGVANDTTTVQNAITAVGAAGGGVVYFPPGTYLINAALTVSNSGVSLVGAGPLTTIIKSSSTTANCISASGAGGFVVSDLQITPSTTSTGKAISLAASSSDSFIERVVISNYVNAVSIASTAQVFISDCLLLGTTSDKVVLTSGNTSNVYVVNTTFGANQTAIEFGDSGGIGLVANCHLGTSANGIVWTSTGTKYRVTGCTGIEGSSVAFTASYDPYLVQSGNGVEGYTEDVASGGTVTPNRLRGSRYIRYRATTTGVAYTVAAPTPTPFNAGFGTNARADDITIQFFNNAAGAVTGWTLNAIYKVNGAISTTNLDKTTITFYWDAETSNWREKCRVVTT